MEANILDVMRENIEQTQAEAIKEFAERLKEKMRNCSMYCDDKHTYYLIGYPLIDNLVKEMGGDEK